MKKCIVNFKEGYVCMTADRLEREEGIIFVYCENELVGAFDLGFIDSIHINETREKPE